MWYWKGNELILILLMKLLRPPITPSCECLEIWSICCYCTQSLFVAYAYSTTLIGLFIVVVDFIWLWQSRAGEHEQTFLPASSVRDEQSAGSCTNSSVSYPIRYYAAVLFQFSLSWQAGVIYVWFLCPLHIYQSLSEKVTLWFCSVCLW